MSWNRHYAAGLAALYVVSAPAWAQAQALVGDQGGPPAAAVVEMIRGEAGERSTLTFYKDRAGSGSPVSWRAVLVEANGAARSAAGSSCPALIEAVSRLERIAPPRIEIQPVETAVGSRPTPPNLGYLHQGYRLSIRAVAADGAPVELTLAHGGAGPVRDWLEASMDALEPCWRSEN